VAERGQDPDWGPHDPSKLDEVRAGLEELNGTDDVRGLEEAVAAALQATSTTPFDREKLWQRLERSLDGEDGPAADGPADGPPANPPT
jgi:hypothetical protein